MKKRILIILLSVAAVAGTGVVCLHYFSSRNVPSRNWIGIIESPEQAAEKYLLACQNGETDLIPQYLTDDVRMRFFHAAVLKNPDRMPREAMRRFAAKVKFQLRSAAFRIERDPRPPENLDHVRLTVYLEYPDSRSGQVLVLIMIRNQNGIWQCDTLL